MASRTLALILLSALLACVPVDEGPCLEWREETTVLPMSMGQGQVMMLPYTIQVCARRG